MVPSSPKLPQADRKRAVTVVGRYALYGEIASGGMATVHLGRLIGPAGFARTVAIKRLHPHLAKDPDFVLMFVDEARIAARIRHPNVVPTIDVVSSGGELLLIMEYVPGESLAQLLRAISSRSEFVPHKIAVALACGLLHGLHAAHEAKGDQGAPLGVVHRDVSPQNVMIGTDGIAHVLDFGVAKAIGRLQSTRAGTLKGKMAYMAPEQLRGEALDRRGDVYAAAVVLWETLTCRRLHRGDADIEVFRKVLEGASAPPSAHVPNLPQGLDDVVMRGLALDAKDRFQTAREMARALEACVVSATPAEVSEWLESMAGALIAERAKVVEEIESSSDLLLGGPMPSSAFDDSPTVISDVRPMPTQPSSSFSMPSASPFSGPGSSPSSVQAGPPLGVQSALNPIGSSPVEPLRTRAATVKLVIAGAGLVVVSVTLTAFFATHTPDNAPDLDSRETTTLATTGQPPAPATAPSASETPSSDNGAPALATATPPGTGDSPHRPGASAPSHAPHVTPAATPAKPHAAGCDPPYYFDANGMKHYKRECN